ncbi:MAG: hypothetical protein JJT99_03640 [Rhodobacteraceae bacterium]|nr:hypothetical protein [Paracoccaceae bacterium]
MVNRIYLNRLSCGGVAKRLRLTLMGVLGGIVLQACDGGMMASFQGESPTELAEALSEYRVVPASRALINVPHALIVLERELDGVLEQRITLPNSTSLKGENVILLRAQTARAASRSRLVLENVLQQFGGAPSPFTSIEESALTATSDAYGDITYTTLRPGGDLTCVLAFRRSQIGSRPLPRGASSLDIMLRNCVSGSAERALQPIMGSDAFGLASPVFGRGS